MNRVPLPFLLPIMALLIVVLWGGGLGALFIFVGKAGAEQWGAVIIGMGVVVGVPTVAALITLPKKGTPE